MAVPQLKTRFLRQAKTADELNVYRSALEWDLMDPIILNKREDFKSEPFWKDKLEPYHHQVSNLITFCRRLPVTLLADDVGLGKTISAGLIISELVVRLRVNNIFIVAPKILGEQWKEELETKFSIPATIAVGKDLISADPESPGAIITTYQSAQSYMDSIPADRFEMLILDEAHKLRNLYGVESPPKMAKQFRKALESRRFRFVLMLTATPIHNRLWDIYSLIDLLTVARGHQNPFGNENLFARRFIEDNRKQARQLKSEARDEFRSIVYSYMSRVRRGDSHLHFPDRIIQMHRVTPSTGELRLYDTVALYIQKLNRLSQISILQALASSPAALQSQLRNMARTGSIPVQFADEVKHIVTGMPPSAKLVGLGSLVERLRRDNPNSWRMVIYTHRVETQTSIQLHLESIGVKVGIINGTTAGRNKQTLESFRANPPSFNVLVSTEAGSEGLNLQIANVLANFDLPWNPMIVEQRIGRIQRLASSHSSVIIFNIMLQGTFEEYIVGRLMEKLQLASQAIGDVEALLEATGIDGEDANESFDEKIRKLVLASLAGRNVDIALQAEEASIAAAKQELIRERDTIDAAFGTMDGEMRDGPALPALPPVVRRTSHEEFTLAALKSRGANIISRHDNQYWINDRGREEVVCLGKPDNDKAGCMVYAPGSSAFQRMVSDIIANGVCDVVDSDSNASDLSNEIVKRWVGSFGGAFRGSIINTVWCCFAGTATLRVRAVVAHDSYERLIDVQCLPGVHKTSVSFSRPLQLNLGISEPSHIGVNSTVLTETALRDEGISEFSRFYLERREHEMRAAEGDDRKRQKLADDFTPRYDISLVGLQGSVFREIELKCDYSISSEHAYSALLVVTPKDGCISSGSELALCERSQRLVPVGCLARCEVTGLHVTRDYLKMSDVSSRHALPEHVVQCSSSGKWALPDECERSFVTGKLSIKAYLETSRISGNMAEPEHFDQCEFTRYWALKSELKSSQVSGKKYRMDEEETSSVTNVKGHKSEFIKCNITGLPLLRSEAETCAVSGAQVRPGMLAECAVSHKRVVPSLMGRCSVTGKAVLRSLLVSSNISGADILVDVAIRSENGKYCKQSEAKKCEWDGTTHHPDDFRKCNLTGLEIYYQYVISEDKLSLKPLQELLDGVRRNTDANHLWPYVQERLQAQIRIRKTRVVASTISPDNRRLAICAEVKTMLGLRVQYIGAIYDVTGRALVGMIVAGQRGDSGWIPRAKG